MRITRWTEFGILCALYITKRGISDELPVTAPEMSNKLGIPLDYTRQILQRLKQGEIVKTLRGPQGGYNLTREPEEITLVDILKAAEGGTFEVMCESDPVCTDCSCEVMLCALRPIWYKLHDHIEHFLRGFTLRDLVVEV